MRKTKSSIWECLQAELLAVTDATSITCVCRCFVTGWGKDAFGPGQYQRLLQEVDVPIVDSFRCENLLRSTKLGHTFNLDKKSFICAGGERGKDACQVRERIQL